MLCDIIYKNTNFIFVKYELAGGMMANKTTVALTQEQFEMLIKTMRRGGSGFRPNNRIATALVIEANLGIRIEDVLRLRLCDIIQDGDRYRLDIKEQKTGKKRTFTVPISIYQFIKLYAVENGIKDDKRLFPITERAVQKHLKKVSGYLGYNNIGTHSFRKFYATDIYKNNNYNIVLVQQLLQHSSVAITQRYIGITSEMQEEAIQKHISLL